MVFHKYVVVGSGRTGLDAALLLAQRGLDVLLIESNDLGGSYLFSNDLPKEFLAKQSLLINSFRKRLPFDMQKSLNVDLERIITNKIRKRYTKIKSQIDRFPNLKYIKGAANFSSKNIIEIQNDERLMIAFENCLICTGLSKMDLPEINGLKQVNFLYQHNAFYGENIPRSLALIGAVKANFEIADIYANLGTKVTIFEKKTPEQILINQDTTTINYMLQNLLNKGVEFFFNAQIIEVKNTNNTNQTSVELTDNENNHHIFETFYINVIEHFKNTLSLENADVKYSHNGIYSSSNGQTNQKNVYAFGACSNAFGNISYKSQLLQYVERQGLGTLDNSINRSRMLIVTNNNQKYNELAVIDFVSEKICLERSIATIGLAYKHAVERLGSYAKFMILINDDLDGFIKIIYNDQTNQVFGISLAGEACDKNYHFAVDCIHKCYNIQEIRSMLICLGFHT